MPDTYKTLEWDKTNERYFEAGVDKCVLYKMNADKTYANGVAWSGVTNITQNPTGGEANDIFADNIKYASIRGAESYEASLTAYTYPDEWMECDGSKTPGLGVYIGQQKRAGFGLCYRTLIGNGDLDLNGADDYMLHLVYGLTADPAERAYDTVNEDPEAIEFEWNMKSVPIKIATPGFRPTSILTIDSRKFKTEQEKALLKALEDTLYGVSTDATTSEAGSPATLPTPDEVLDILELTPAG